MRRTVFFAAALWCLSSVVVSGQEQPAARAAYDAKFFQVLQTVFDKFGSSDLQRAFQAAQPIGCSELQGNWRPTAFFNDDRNLERWFYKSFDEVQSDLTRYIFRGRCNSESANVDVSTRFPVAESLAAYNSKKIDFDQIVFRTNTSVRATFDSKARTYTFELPYLYLTGRRNNTNQYGLVPPSEAAKFAEEVTNHWDCKAIKAADVTYRFIICRTAIVPRNQAIRSQAQETRGTSAYVVLTDGREAVSTVALSYEGGSASTASGNAIREVVNLTRQNFRLKFASSSWEDKIESVVVIAGGRLDASKGSSDYCEWRPQSPATARLVNDTDKSIQYFVDWNNASGPSPSSVSFEARTTTNFRLGTLRCYFPGTESVGLLSTERLSAIFGDHIGVEFR